MCKGKGELKGKKSQKEKDADYYQKHTKKIKQRVSAYQQKNKEKIAEYHRKWYLKRKGVK